MPFTPESKSGLEAGVAPFQMQQNYNAIEQAKRASIVNSLQGFSVAGQQNTTLSPEQLQMTQEQRQLSADRYNLPAYSPQEMQDAKAIDAANLKARYDAYMVKQAQQASQLKPQNNGFFSSLSNYLSGK